MEQVSIQATHAEKRVFGYVEVVFNALYLLTAAAFGIYLLARAQVWPQTLAGIMAFILAAGDTFHLVPRMMAAVTKAEYRLKKALGLGKLIASITMTVFYVLLWHIGVLLFSPSGCQWTALAYVLAAIRIALCLPRQNGWYDDAPPLHWGIYRNIPFLLLGAMVALLYGMQAQGLESLRLLWIAVALSFVFYIPVVLFASKYRKIGMLMLPKTCAYLWILYMFVRMV